MGEKPAQQQMSFLTPTTIRGYVRAGGELVMAHLRQVRHVVEPPPAQLSLFRPAAPAPEPEPANVKPEAPAPRPAPKPDARHGLTILRMGLGRDSLTMLVLLGEGKLRVQGKLLGPKDVDAVVFSDTGMEWPHTLAMIPRVHEFCRQHGIRFIVLSKPPEEQWRPHLAQRVPGVPLTVTPPWRSAPLMASSVEVKAMSGTYHARGPLMDDYASKASIVRFKDGSCTENHKILPNRALMDDLGRERLGAGNASWGAAVRRGDAHPHRVLIGFAADEMTRADEAGGVKGPDYEQNLYPLIEMGVTKADEQPILERGGFGDAIKSGCFMCKFQPLGWYWALGELYPGLLERVGRYEDAARAKNPKMMIFPKDAPIREAVVKWRERNPTATIPEILAKDYLRPCEQGTCHQEAA